MWGKWGENIRQAETFGLDSKVKHCAEVLGDRTLLGKLSAGDLIAIDFVYHVQCLVSLYRRAESVESKSRDNLSTKF